MDSISAAAANILHVDMDTFFVSVERLNAPKLHGVPCAVAHDSPRSVISAASYEARNYGVRSAMPVAAAKQRCPHLLLVPPRMELYQAVSKRVMGVLAEFTPLVEAVSIDEAFLDVSGAQRIFGQPLQIAHKIRQRLASVTGLPASVGVAATKHIAKLASQRAKPAGVFQVLPAETLAFLYPLPVAAIWGVGAATQQALERHAIHTVADLAAVPLQRLQTIVGKAAATKLHDLAHGRDGRAVENSRVDKSISSEQTFLHDVAAVAALQAAILRQAQTIGYRLRDKKLLARTIAVKLRFNNFQTLSRSHTLGEATDTSQRIYRVAVELLNGALEGSAEISSRPVRLLGVRAEQLLRRDSADLGLWQSDEEWRAVEATSDLVRKKFGDLGLSPARLLGKQLPD